MVKIRSLYRNKRGVSEIIASLILILIVSAAGVLAYSISMTAFSSSSSNYQLQTVNKEEKAQERLEVLAIQQNTTTNLKLTVLNYGLIDLTVNKVYVNGIIATTYLTGTGVKTAPSVIVTVTFVSPVPIVSGQVYDLIVVSERGSKNEVSWQA
jgi:flagellin-like protein